MDELTVCLLDKNKDILKFLKKNRINHITSNFVKDFEKIKKNQY